MVPKYILTFHEAQEPLSGLVTKFGGQPTWLGEPHWPLSRSTERPMRFHGLRHSAATILLTMGVSPNVVQEILGHNDIKITLGIYGRVLPGMRGQAMERMGEALNRVAPDADGDRLSKMRKEKED